MINWRSQVQSLVVFNFCALNQTTESVQTSFSPQTLRGVRALLHRCPCQIGTSQCMRTDLDSAQISPDSIGLCGIPHQNGAEYVGESKDLIILESN